MSIQKSKKGFTLIELMVVIVIIGILAAIAIPKLFGMTAKAKAQEIPPAASTWLKLQQAAVAELGKYGGNQKIAYVFPGAPDAAKNDKGGDGGSHEATSGFVYKITGVDLNGLGEAEVTWSAEAPMGKLGDCTTAGAVEWKVIMPGIGEEAGTDAYITAEIGDGTLADCEALTPRFKDLDTHPKPVVP